MKFLEKTIDSLKRILLNRHVVGFNALIIMLFW